MAVANAQELFNVKVPADIAKSPDKAREIGAVYWFKIAGDGGGEWTVDLASNPPTCTAGLNGTAKCTISIAHPDFMDMLQNPSKGMQLYFTGKLKVDGDPMLATKLQKLFSLS
jgi:hypothetical protein